MFNTVVVSVSIALFSDTDLTKKHGTAYINEGCAEPIALSSTWKLFLHPEDRGNMLLRHVGIKLQSCAVSKPRTPQLECIYVCAKSEVTEMCL
jgi:hypothetical protein